MNPLRQISREELARALDRSSHGADLGRRQPDNHLANYFRERRLLTARVRELLAGRRERMTNDSIVAPHLCSCVAAKSWDDGDDRVPVLRPPAGFTAHRHCTVCGGTGELPDAPEVDL